MSRDYLRHVFLPVVGEFAAGLFIVATAIILCGLVAGVI